MYGAQETFPLEASEATHENVDYSQHVTLADPNLQRIVRVRLLTDRGLPFYDISYVYGQMVDGSYVRLSDVPMHLPKPRYKSALVQWAKDNGRYAKGLGMLDCISILS